MFRSIAAIVAGFIAVVAVPFAGDAVLCAAFPHAFNARGVTDQPGMLAIQLGYTALATVLGGLVAGLVAGHRPVFHALLLGLVGLVLTTATLAMLPPTLPWWYRFLAGTIPLPGALLGGTLGARRMPTRTGMPVPPR